MAARRAIAQSIQPCISRRHHSHLPGASKAYLDAAPMPSTSESPVDLTPRERQLLESIVRVDQAGELAANQIYKGQLAVFRKPELRALIQDMWDGEKKHIETFDKLITQHRVRPTAFYPLWRIAGWSLGAGTALMGREAGMACTEAVEVRAILPSRPLVVFTLERRRSSASTTTSALRRLALPEPEDAQQAHSQLKALGNMPSKHPSIALLKEVLTEFRDDELEHLDTAVENDAQKAPAHALLSAIIASGCRGAIAISKKI